MIINQDSLHLKFDIEVKTSEKNDETTINGNKYKYIFKQSDQNFSKLNKKNLIKKIVLEDNFRNNLEKLDLNFYLIIWSKNFLFCTVDHISSFQLLYKITDKKIVIKDNLSELNFVSNQFARKTIINSGYTLGAQTLSNSYKTLMPCEYIIYNNRIKNENK